ncbi:penicillin-binding protein 1C [Reichenbachiella sp. MALMAid0571]|uniref:penicillin-binding protein 1C n=1 Tax=Reichenbachiella sp. MALMAid0571 TaxID=3143939 RepID=UPI0032DEB1C0
MKSFFLVIFLLLFVASLLFVVFPYKPKIEYSPIVLSKDSVLMHSFLTSDDKWRMFTDLDEITPTLKKAIIFKEDRFFYYHFGINPISIFRAAFNNIFKGRRTSGASTITMQVARLLQPKERSYANKLVEVFRAFQLEWRYSKDEILQMYLNLVPYGGNIEGVKAASLIYFEKMPNHLSIAEITALSIIPNRPNSLRIGKSNALIVQERNKWLDRFEQEAVFSDEAIGDAKEEVLIAQRKVLPKIAPHLSFRLKQENSDLNIIHSSVDINSQLKVEAIVYNYIQQLYQNNIRNAAALVLDNEIMQVVAYVGSADFYNNEDGGQVDGIQAVRSPGSTLKPLLYGMAIDKGLLTPKTIISDVPVNFSGYQPQNYQESFNGNVSMEYALSNSLNIPAVKVLDKMQTYPFIEALSNAGFEQIKKDKAFLGLSTVLGGCGVTLEELTRLYAAFSHGGLYSNLNFLANDTISFKYQVISEAATFMISEILTTVTRPDLPAQWKNATYLPKVAWKTGTSYRRRDAWSVGFNKKYTIGVWAGNFSGEGVQELTGSDIASPLLFNIFNAIDQESSKEWFRMPKGVNFRYVCTETGMIPNDFCDQQQLDYFLPGISDYQPCNHSKFVYVSADSTKSYCSACLPQNGYIKARYPNHQPEILSYFESERINYIKIPPHNLDCERLFTESVPKIISPIDKLEYLVDKTDSLQIMLSSQTANNVNQVFWYINNRFYQSALANENIYFTPNEGRVKISCTDDKGRNTDIEIEVKKIRF